MKVKERKVSFTKRRIKGLITTQLVGGKQRKTQTFIASDIYIRD